MEKRGSEHRTTLLFLILILEIRGLLNEESVNHLHQGKALEWLLYLLSKWAFEIISGIHSYNGSG